MFEHLIAQFKRCKIFPSKKEEYKIQVLTDHLTNIEQIIVHEMIQSNNAEFILRYRLNHYDKETYDVYLSPNVFQIKYLNKPTKVYLKIKDECGHESDFKDYVNYRGGDIFNNHNWFMCNKINIQNKFNNLNSEI